MPWSQQFFNQLVIQGNNAGIFIYNGTPGLNTLIGSWAAVAGVDPYGNPYPAGINVTQGSLQSVNITNAAIVASTMLSSLISASQIQSSAMTGGTITETVITFDSGGGGLFLYTTTTTTTTFTTPGTTTYTGPAGVATLDVLVWGADAGGDGGTTAAGGPGGGGAEFARETSYPNVPGKAFSVAIGQAGTGGTTGNPGGNGGQSAFDQSGVVAGGGLAAVGTTGGLGGNISANAIHYPGGNGGNWISGTASAGGGGRAGSTGPGGNGGNASGSPGAAGAAGSGSNGIAGGAGVAASTNGNNGGGGSGAGRNTGVSNISKSYRPIDTVSYYGQAAGGAIRNVNDAMYQGNPNVPATSIPGDQYSFAIYNRAAIQSDFNAATFDSVKVEIQNAHSWYSTGCYIIWGYSNSNDYPSPGPPPSTTFNVQNNWINQGADATFDLTSSPILNALQTNQFESIALGPGGNVLWNYGYFNGGTSYGPLLKLTGHIGSTSRAGNGSNGRVSINSQGTRIFVGGMSPIAGTDTGGNAYPAGYIGDVASIHPGSSPAVVETLQTLTLLNSWTNRGGFYIPFTCIKVPGGPNGIVYVMGALTHSSLTTGQSSVLGTLPTGYLPAHNFDWQVNIISSTPYTTISGVSGLPALEITTNGNITLWNYPSGTTGVQFCVSFPLGV